MIALLSTRKKIALLKLVHLVAKMGCRDLSVHLQRIEQQQTQELVSKSKAAKSEQLLHSSVLLK